jgi:hypothetical protein
MARRSQRPHTAYSEDGKPVPDWEAIRLLRDLDPGNRISPTYLIDTRTSEQTNNPSQHTAPSQPASHDRSEGT